MREAISVGMVTNSVSLLFAMFLSGVPCPRLRGHVGDFSVDSHAHDKRGHGTVSSATETNEPAKRRLHLF
jgi:hypothetical protein